MSLRKSPTLTPALLETNRHNTQKSTGPRMAWGAAQARMNSPGRPLSSSTGRGGSRTAPTCTRVNCRAERESTTRPNARLRHSGFGASVTIRPYGTEKEFFFTTFEAGILLKTNEA